MYRYPMAPALIHNLEANGLELHEVGLYTLNPVDP
jgi:hypothetical protein